MRLGRVLPMVKGMTRRTKMRSKGDALTGRVIFHRNGKRPKSRLLLLLLLLMLSGSGAALLPWGPKLGVPWCDCALFGAACRKLWSRAGCEYDWGWVEVRYCWWS